MQPTSVSQESQLGSSVFDHSIKLNTNSNLEGYPPFLYNSLYFDGIVNFATQKRPKNVASLSLSSRCGASSIRRAFHEFNRFIKLHCERIPLKFASVRVGSRDGNGLRENDNGVLEGEEVHTNVIGSESPKKVLILMSDTGGGHRASAEAIKAAFSEEYGDDYQVRFVWLRQNLYLFFMNYGLN